MEDLYEKYGEEVEFYLVYLREAHPSDGWQTRANEREDIVVKQPTTFKERTAVAHEMCERLELDLPTLIDGMDNKVANAYAALPDRLYLIGKDGTIAFKGDRGPRGFRPDELEKAIKNELAVIGVDRTDAGSAEAQRK